MQLVELLFDEKEVVRKTLYLVAHRLLTILPDRHTYAYLILPLLISGLSDSFGQNRKEAETRWDNVGKIFLAENEEEFKDLIEYENPLRTFPNGKYFNSQIIFFKRNSKFYVNFVEFIVS